MKPAMSAVLVLTLGVFLSACSGDDNPVDPGPVDGGDGAARTVKETPSFANDVYEVFTRRGCSAGSCHGAGAGGLTMSGAAATYTALVNVVSPNSGEVLVIPGNANDSYLVKKLEGRQSVGARMPIGGGALDNTDLTNIKNWINQGATNN